MFYLYIPIGLTALLLIYVLYLAFSKQLKRKFRTTVLPGLFFIGIWGTIYFFIVR